MPRILDFSGCIVPGMSAHDVVALFPTKIDSGQTLLTPGFVIKSSMLFYDIIFPLSLGPLTYRCPEELAAVIEPGIIVAAPLRNRVTHGIVLRKTETPPEGRLRDRIKDLIGPAGTVISKALLRLIPWMSEYYIASEGMILKQTLPPELFESTRMIRQRKTREHIGLELPELPVSVLDPITAALPEKKFRPFLIHALSVLQEYAVVRAVIEKTQNVIILVPEISQADLLYQMIHQTIPGQTIHGVNAERVCVLHSALSRGRRSAYVEGIAAGKYDIVIGTRHALFAPLKKVFCIMVLQEHSSFYKMEDGIRYHMRDVAVKRAYLEKSVVILSSITPSIDSYYNAQTGKYGFIRPDSLQPVPKTQPKISIVDMRYCKKTTPALSKTAINIAGSRLKIGKNVMFIVNRKGYATLICRECENTVACPDCGIALVMHKDDMMLRCHYCGRSMEIPLQCSRCRSITLEPVGSGTERVQEEIEKVLGAQAVRFDKDAVKKRSDITAILKNISVSRSNLLIGTKLLTTHLTILHRFSLAVILNIDASTNFPDFRASEKAFAELSSILSHIDPDGDMLIQTRAPGNPMLRYFKAGNYHSFVQEELAVRKTLSYPPFARMIEITVAGGTELAEKIVMGLHKTAGTPATEVRAIGVRGHVEVLGPVASQSRHGLRQTSIFLKSTDRKALNRMARSVMDTYGKKDGTGIRIDVDPA